jgi:serine phosphatase RsbU (regulator of sigma subunit)
MVADGLGHGSLVSQAAAEARRVFESNPFTLPKAYLENAHSAMHSTRGAAVAAVQIDSTGGTLRYAGVGNISGTLITDQQIRGLFSHNGILGVQVRKVQEFDYPWMEHSLLVMHSDGLATRWNLSEYVGLTQRHASVIAGVLYRDFKRGRDDATVVVLRPTRAGHHRNG